MLRRSLAVGRFARPILRPLYPANSLLPLISNQSGNAFFSTTKPSQFLGPYKTYQRSTLLNKATALIPYPVKVFGSIALGAAVTVLVAPALIILCLPPLVMGIFFYRRRMQQFQKLLRNDRWSNLKSYDMDYNETAGDSIVYEAKSRVAQAIRTNEGGLGDAIPVSTEDIQYTPLESLYQDFNNKDGVVSVIQVRQYGLLDANGKRRATVNLVVLVDPMTTSKKLRIEVKAKNGVQCTLSKDAEAEDTIIDVK